MISSFLQDIPRHDTRLFEVREAFKRTLLFGFCAYIRAYIAKKNASGDPPGGPSGGLAHRTCAAGLGSPVAVPATDAGPLINALITTVV